MEEFRNHPILLTTNENDWGWNFKAGGDNTGYFQETSDPKELKFWPDAGHGYEVIERKGDFDVFARC